MGKVNISYQNDAISGIEKGFIESIPEGYRELSDVENLSSLGVDALISEVLEIARGNGGEIFSFFLVSFGVALMTALAGLYSSPMSRSVRGGVSAVGCMAILSSLYPLFFSVRETLDTLGAFFTALVPTLTSFLALGGGTRTALGAASGLSITLWLTGLIGGELLTPMVAAIFAGSAVSSAVGGASERVSASIARSFRRLMGAISAVVAAVFGLQTYVSVAADSLGVRAAKYASAGLVPAVGGVVSGALGALGGGLSLLGGVIGASSVAVIVAMSLSPLVLLLLYKGALYLCSLFLEFTGTDGKGSPISALSSALDALISVYVLTIIIYIFEVIILIWGGRSIFE